MSLLQIGEDSGEISAVYNGRAGLGQITGSYAGASIALSWREASAAGILQVAVAGGCDRLDGTRTDAGGGVAAWHALRIAGSATPALDPVKAVTTADQLSTVASMLERRAALLPENGFDPTALASSLGNDPERITGWVADNTRPASYEGESKGAFGVYMERRGSSLDRAELLAALLSAAGFEVQLAHAPVPDSEAEELAARALSAPPDPEPLPGGDAMDGIDADTAGLDRPGYQAALAAMDAAAAAPLPALQARHAELAAALLAAVLPAAAPAASDQVAAVRDHWWVLRRDSHGGWVDHDPDGLPAPDAAAIVAADQVDPALAHAVTLTLVLEVWEDGAPHETVLLAHRFRASEVLGKTILLTHAPLTIATPHSAQDLLAADGPQLSALFSETSWAPMIRVGGQMFSQSKFSFDGTVSPFDPNELAAGSPARLAAAGGAALDAAGALLPGLGSDNQESPVAAAAPADRTTAEFLDVTVEGPGAPARTYRRAVFDVIGDAGRAEGGDVAIGSNAAAARASGLAGIATIDISSAQPSPAYLLGRFATERAAAFRRVGEVLQAAATGQWLEMPGEDFSLRPELVSYHLARRAMNGGAVVAAPNVTILWWRPHRGADGALSETLTFDVVANDTAPPTYDPSERFQGRLSGGVADTIAESLALPSGDGPSNVAELYAADPASWRLLRPGDEATLAALSWPDDARASLAATLRGGYLAVVPPAPVEGKIGWWRVDPKTGAALGIMSDGYGEDETEYTLLSKIAAWNDFIRQGASLAVCLYKSTPAMTGKQAGTAVTCMIGALAWGFGQFMKIVDLMKWYEWSRGAKNVFEFIRAVGGDITFGGTLISLL